MAAAAPASRAITDFARGIHIDTDRLEQLAEGFDPSNPEELRDAVVNGALIPPKTEEQLAALGRLETMLALIEGWVDVVTADATKRLPKSDAIAETVRRRRASGGPAESAFATLVGLELRPRRLREAAAMWRAVTDAVGVEARDALWAHPDLLPTAADIDDPTRLVARLTGADTAESEADDESTRRSSSCCAARPPRRPARTARSRRPDGPSAASGPTTAASLPCGRMPRGRPRVGHALGMAPRIDPALPLVWRTPTDVQLGATTARVVLRDAGDLEIGLIAALRHGASIETLRTIGAGLGGAIDDVERVLAMLEPAFEERQVAEPRRARVPGRRPGRRADRRSAVRARGEPRVVVVDADGVLAERLIADLTALGYHATTPPAVDDGGPHDDEDAAADRPALAIVAATWAIPPARHLPVAASRRAAPRRRVRRHRGARRSARRAGRRAVPAVPRSRAPRRRPRVAGDRRPAGGAPGRDRHDARLASRRRRSRSPSSTTGSRTGRWRWRMPR